MSGPKRNADKLNTIGVVVVGICGAVMVYVTIVALQAFYMNDTSEIQTMADYGGQDVTAKSHKADEMRNITESASNGAAPGTPQTYRVPIDHAMEEVAKELAVPGAKPFHLVPGLDRGGDEKDWITATKPTIPAFFGRPKPATATTPTPSPAPTDGGSGAGSAAPTAPATGSATPATPAPPGGHAP